MDHKGRRVVIGPYDDKVERKEGRDYRAVVSRNSNGEWERRVSG